MTGRAAAVADLYSKDRVAHALGIELLAVEADGVRVAMMVREDMLNGHSICHGGIVFALADTAFAYACNAAAVPMVAAGANIELLAPTRPGERLIAVARETMRTERHGIYDVAVASDGGELRAHFRGRCARLRAT
jgi:acyl-CoA thioesterase